MISQWAEQQMDHSTTHAASPIPTLTSPSSLAASEATTSSSPTTLPSLSPSSPLALLLPLHLFSVTSSLSALSLLHLQPVSQPFIFSLALLLRIYLCPSFRFLYLQLLSPTPSLPYLLLPNPSSALSTPFHPSSLLPAPSVSFYNSGQLTWCMVLWGFPMGVTIVVSDRCVSVCVCLYAPCVLLAGFHSA